jgi:hypothetical protein
LTPFHPLFTNPHWQTIGGAFWPRRIDYNRFPDEERYYRTEPGTQVLVHVQRPLTSPKGTLVLVHGLEGSSEAGYMRSAAQAALDAGFAVHRMNIRGCGGTERLSNTLYHAGLTSDVAFVAGRLRQESEGPLYLAGFSLGGNMVLKFAGELGERARELVTGVCAISTPLDLRACALALNHPRNWLYQQRFVASMSVRLRRRHALMPDVFPLNGLDSVRSVYEFDDRITAPFFGFQNAERYYGTQSAALYLEAIRVPALLIQAKDDPMIPFKVYDHPAFRTNCNLRLLAVDHGGHVGFLAKGRSRFWADHALVHWLSEVGNKNRPQVVF